MHEYNPKDKVRHFAVTPTEEQKDVARRTPLHKDGDMVLVWVNEGDLIEANLR